MDTNNESADKAEEYKSTLIQGLCQRCDGRGYKWFQGHEQKCYICNGLGMYLTSLGEEIERIAKAVYEREER